MILRPILRPALRSPLRSVFEGGVGGAPVPVYPLDIAGELPEFAYGTRRLTSTYSGPALRLVRGSDSATLDVPFAGPVIDEGAVAAFLGGSVGQVDIWYDQSGNERHATQDSAADRPLVLSHKIGGSLALAFDGLFMNIPSSAQFSRRACDVYSVADLVSSNIQAAILQLGSGTSQVTPFQTATTNGVGAFQINGGQVGASTFRPQTKPCLFRLRQSETSALFAQDDEQKTAGAATAVVMEGGMLGNTSVSAGFKARSYQACHIAYARVLAAAEESALTESLQSAYALSAGNPGRRVIFEGDSIAAASTYTGSVLHWDGYAKQAAQLLYYPAGIYNVAGGGSQVQNEITYFSNQSGLLLGQYPSDNRVVFLSIGTNDLTLGGRTAEQIYEDIQTFAGLVRAAGGKVVVSTILPNAAWNGTQEATQATLNASIRDNWATFADGLADFAADPTMGPYEAAHDLALYPDGLHPSRLGHSYLAPIAAAAINALL